MVKLASCHQCLERLLAVLPWLSVSEIALLHNNFSKDAVANVDRDCEHLNTNLKEVSRSTQSHRSTISARLACGRHPFPALWPDSRAAMAEEAGLSFWMELKAMVALFYFGMGLENLHEDAKICIETYLAQEL